MLNSQKNQGNQKNKRKPQSKLLNLKQKAFRIAHLEIPPLRHKAASFPIPRDGRRFRATGASAPTPPSVALALKPKAMCNIDFFNVAQPSGLAQYPLELDSL
jgi:hypothetical protein